MGYRFKVCVTVVAERCVRHHCEGKRAERRKVQLFAGLYYEEIDSGEVGHLSYKGESLSAPMLIEYSSVIVYQKTVCP